MPGKIIFLLFGLFLIGASADMNQTKVNSFTCDPSAPPPNCPVHDPNGPAVHLPHQSDCTKFYECDWGVAYLMPCPPTLHFNPVLQVCDYPERAGCKCATGILPTPEPVPTPGGGCTTPSNTTPGGCTTQKPATEAPTSPPPICTTPGSTTTGSDICTTPAATTPTPITPIPTTPIPTTSPICTTLPPTTPTPTTPIPTTPNPTTPPICTTPAPTTPTPTIPNPTSSPPVICTTPAQTTPTPTTPNLTTPPPVSCSTPAPNDSVTKQSAICDPNAGPPKCPEYNPERLVAHLPHENDCTKFYKCSGDVPYILSCPENLHFNPTLEVCDYPDNAGCVCANITL